MTDTPAPLSTVEVEIVQKLVDAAGGAAAAGAKYREMDLTDLRVEIKAWAIKRNSDINSQIVDNQLLFYQQGFTYQEISEILSAPINTIKTHILRGKEQLKEKLKNYGQNSLNIRRMEILDFLVHIEIHTLNI